MRLLAAGLAVALTTAFWLRDVVFSPAVVRTVSQWTGDLFAIYQPLHRFAYADASSFPPLWNPYQLAGVPALAMLNGGLLYPVHLLSLVLDAPVSLAVQVGVHLAVAALSAMLLAAEVGISPVAGLVAAVVFALHRMVEGGHLQPSYLAGHSLVPAFLAAFLRTLRRPDAASATLLGAVVALQVLSGHPQIIVYQGYAAVLLGIPVVLARLGIARLARIAVALAAAAAGAAALSAIQLLPSLEVLAQASRQRLSYTQTLPRTWGTAFSLEFAYALGPALPLAVYAWRDRSRRAIVAGATVMLAGCALVGLGVEPASRLFHALPLVDRFRLQVRILVPATAAAALLAAIGAQRLVDGEDDRRSAAWWLAIAAAIVLAAGAPTPLGRWAIVAVAIALVARGTVTGGWRRALPALACGGIAAAPFARAPSALFIPAHADATSFAPPAFVRVLRDLGTHERTMLVRSWRHRERMAEKTGAAFGVRVIQDYEPLAPAVYARFLAPLGRLNTDAPLFWGRFTVPAEAAHWRMLDLLSTAYVAVDADRSWNREASGRFSAVHRDATATLWQRSDPVPRARLVRTGIETVPDPEPALARVMAADFDPRRQVVVDRLPASSGQPSVGPVVETVEWVEDGRERVVLRVTSPDDAVLVLGDLYWPGWTATVDGVDAPILRADYLFRAVHVAAGEHLVTFAYRPWTYVVGRTISAVAWGAVAVGCLLGARRRWPRLAGRHDV